ncbi:MAG: hypothetical protein Q8O56_17245 [Solirubrobacteraceae bacterium]|nr:hypothetical protein [Solirubrobacteraceae bacterium]
MSLKVFVVDSHAIYRRDLVASLELPERRLTFRCGIGRVLPR